MFYTRILKHSTFCRISCASVLLQFRGASRDESWRKGLSLSNPVNMPDPTRKRFGYGQLWPLRPACSQNRTGSYRPNPTSCVRFSSVFPKKAWVILCKTDPDPIWTALSRFGHMHLIWKQAGVLESSGPVSASFLLSDSVPFFHRRPG